MKGHREVTDTYDGTVNDLGMKPRNQHVRRRESSVDERSRDIEDSTRDHHDDSKFPRIQQLGRVFSKSIVGDIFGTTRNANATFVASLAYRARALPRSEVTLDNQDSTIEVKDLSQGFSNEESLEDDGIDEEFKMLKRMNPKQKTALTLKNWSIRAENDDKLIKEGKKRHYLQCVKERTYFLHI